jgi:rhodanese-related sulfurtransferase
MLDVRSEEEWKDGHILGAKFAPWQTVEASPALPADKNAPIVTYCVAGVRAQKAALKLRELGYTHVVAVDGGGYQELVAAGLHPEK